MDIWLCERGQFQPFFYKKSTILALKVFSVCFSFYVSFVVFPSHQYPASQPF